MRASSWSISSAFMPAAGSSSSSSAGFAAMRAGEFEPPLLAEREIGGELVALVREIEELERPVDLRARAARAAEPARAESFSLPLLAGILRHPQILPDGQLAEQADVLERARDARAPRAHAAAAPEMSCAAQTARGRR